MNELVARSASLLIALLVTAACTSSAPAIGQAPPDPEPASPSLPLSPDDLTQLMCAPRTDDLEIVVLLSPDVSREDLDEIVNTFDQDSDLDRYTFVAKDSVYLWLQDVFEDSEQFHASISQDELPPAFRVGVNAAANPDRVAARYRELTGGEVC